MLPVTIDACVCSDAPMAFVVDHQAATAGTLSCLHEFHPEGPRVRTALSACISAEQRSIAGLARRDPDD